MATYFDCLKLLIELEKVVDAYEENQAKQKAKETKPEAKKEEVTLSKEVMGAVINSVSTDFIFDNDKCQVKEQVTIALEDDELVYESELDFESLIDLRNKINRVLDTYLINRLEE